MRTAGRAAIGAMLGGMTRRCGPRRFAPTAQEFRGGKPMRAMIAIAISALCLFGTPALLSAAEPIATTDGEATGTRIEIQELKRVTGGTVMLRFVAVNDSDQDIPN